MNCSVPAAGTERVATLRAVGAAAVAAVALRWLHPYHAVFAFDRDEGINAIKGLLLARGHELYGTLWNDQPPLFTHLLRLWCDVFGWEVDAGRGLVLCFAAGTVFALYDLVRLEAGEAAGAAAAVLLTASTVFARLSVSLMIGLPAVALATLALWSLVRWRHDGAGIWLALSGALMGAALATKLFVAMLVPIFAVWLAIVGARDGDPRARWRAPALWLLGSALTTALLLLVLVGPASIEALVSPHLAARRAPLLARYGAGGLLLTSVADWPLTLLGLAGGALILASRRWNLMVLPAWIGGVALALLTHAPVWYHHAILFTVPLAACGGVALARVFGGMRGRPASAPIALRLAAAGLFAALLLWTVLCDRLPAATPLAGSPTRVLAEMQALRAVTQVIVTTDPMYAFRAGFDVPPELAVLSLERVATDSRLPAAVIDVFAARAPQQVIIADDTPAPLRGWIEAAMGGAYRSRLHAPGVELFVRSEALPDARVSGP